MLRAKRFPCRIIDLGKGHIERVRFRSANPRAFAQTRIAWQSCNQAD